MVQTAMLERHIESVFGWPLRIITSPNQRTLYNFPCRHGAEMLRLAACRLCEAGIIPSMLIHDGMLLEVRDREQIAQAIEIMKTAGRDVCDGFEIGVDIDQLLENGARYQDKRPMAKGMWATIMRVLADVRAIAKEQGYGHRQGKRILVETHTPAAPKRRWKRKPFKVDWAGRPRTKPC